VPTEADESRGPSGVAPHSLTRINVGERLSSRFPPAPRSALEVLIAAYRRTSAIVRQTAGIVPGVREGIVGRVSGDCGETSVGRLQRSAG